MKYSLISSTCVFLLGYLDTGNLNPAGPYFWCTMVLFASFFLGIWGLFSLFDITKRNMLLINHRFVKKALILKTILVLINCQVPS